MKSYSIVLCNAEFTLFIDESMPYENLQLAPPHIHALPELFIILEGNARISGDFGCQRITNKEICLIPPRVYHDIINDSSYIRLAIKFWVNRVENGSDTDIYSLFYGVLSGEKPFKTTFSPILTGEIFDCLKQKNYFYKEKLEGLLLLIFIEIAESLKNSKSKQKDAQGATPKKSRVEWLALNDIKLCRYARGEISIKQLEKEVFLTCRQISRIMATEYEMNLNEYRIKTRMRQAEFYLTKTEMSLKEIAEKLGFSSKESFAVCFKDYYNVSPLKLAKQEQNKS